MADAAPQVRLSLLGPVNVTGAERAERLLAQPKLVTLLAYIVLGSSAGYLSRERIIGVFWPEQTEDRARSSLRTALYSLNELLGCDLTRRHGELLGVDADRVACDAYDFMEAIRTDQLALALELYRGPLLEGLFPDTVELERWLEAEREKYRAAAADAAWALADRYERKANDLTSAARWARRAARLAGTDERRIRRVMSLLDRAGDTAGAIALYEEFSRFLSRELDVDPSEETQALARSIRDRRPAAG